MKKQDDRPYFIFKEGEILMYKENPRRVNAEFINVSAAVAFGMRIARMETEGVELQQL